MNQLVFVEKGQAVTDSLTVACVFNKRHDIVIRDIENQIEKLNIAGEQDFSLHNFEESVYQNERGRDYRKFNMTEEAFTLVAMSYVTPEAMKFKVKFIQEFKRIKEQLVKPRVLSEREQLMASMKLSLETAEELDQVRGEVKEIRGMVEQQITLDHGEQRRLQKAVATKVYEISDDPNERPKYFRELYREIKDRFGVASYKDVKRKEMQTALNYIEAWIPKKQPNQAS